MSKMTPVFVFIVYLFSSEVFVFVHVCFLRIRMFVCKGEQKEPRERQSVDVFVSLVMSLVSFASPLQKKLVQSSVGDHQSPRSSSRPLLMRTFSDESNTVI